ncbi:MAG: DUF2341 domain-containing protein [Bacteroidia bacterium]
MRLEKKLWLQLLAVCLMLAPPGAAMSQCFSGWSNLVEVVVSNPNGTALTNQPVLVTLNTQSLIGAGKLRADAGDLRFADTDCCTPLDYYVEAGSINTTATRLWVEVPAVPANGSRKIILYYGNVAATSLSNVNTTFPSIGNDSTGVASYSADRTFNTKLYAFPFDVTTNVWRIYSGNTGSMSLKTTSSANQVVATTGSISIGSGFNSFDRELIAPIGGHPGFYVGSGGNLQIGNGTPFAPPCGGSAAAFLGNTNLGVGSNLNTQSCGVFPNIKVWYRRRYVLEPTTSLGPELSFAATISISSPAGGPRYCSNGLLLTATTGFTTYQWFRDNSPIPGATSSSYTAPPQPGGAHAYRCEAVLGSCINKVSNTLNLTINPVPVLTAISPDFACAPTTTLGETHTLAFGSLAGYQWNFGDATTGTQATPTHTYPSHGTYSTTLVVVSDSSCKDTLVENVIIYPKPDAVFSAPVTNCDFTAVPFVNNSTVNSAFGSSITSWQWAFGDASTSTLASPGSHAYPGPGVYTPTLITTTNFGCKDTASQTLNVYPKPVIQSISAPAVCEVNASQFSASITLGPSPASSLSTYNWSYGDAQTGTGPTPSHTYTNPGTYTVELIAITNRGCSDTLSTTHQYHPKPNIVSITAPPVCEPLPTTMTNQSSVSTVNGSVISSYLWDFGDAQQGTGSTVTHAYALSDTYTVRLITVTNKGCRDTLFKQMDVYPKPVINSITDPAICWNLPVQFTQSSNVAGTFGGQITQYAWSFGDATNGTGASTQHPYPAAGRYTAQLITTTNHNCKDTLTAPVVVYPKPVIASITIADVCDPSGHSYAQSSQVDTLFASTIPQWNWNFGDGNTGTGSSVQHDYLAPGAYLTTLIVETNHACRDTLTDSVFLFPKPLAGFENPDRCVPEAYAPLDTSAVATTVGAQIVGWHWDFGDSYTSTQQAPSHNYQTPGSYPVELIVTTNHGCKDTVLQVMHYNPKPEAAFSWTTNCWPQPAAFTDGSTISNAFLQDWNWQFGDGGSDTVPNPQHPYAVADTYSVQLIVGSNQGCRDTAVAAVVSNPKPLAEFEVTHRCTPLPLPFHNLSTVSVGSLIQYRWDFGDGGADTMASPNHAYALADSYRVALTVYSDSGCTDTIEKMLVVNPGPTAEFGVNLVCLPDDAQFTDASSGVIVGWEWSFGDGNTDTVPSPLHHFAAPGLYPIQLVVTTDSACTDTLLRGLDVFPHPVMSLGPDGYYCAFDTLTLAPSPQFPAEVWNDGSTLDSLRIWAAGTYWVEITDSNLCTARDTIVLSAAPTIHVDVQPGPAPELCEGETLTLDASHPDGFSWHWNDGSTDDRLVVDTSGVFTVVIYNAYACRDTDTVTVALIPRPVIELGADTAFCQGDSVLLDPGNDGLAWAWSNGDTTRTVLVGNGGIYTVTVTGAAGCHSTDFITLLRHPLPIVDLGPDTAVCQGMSFTWDAGPGYMHYLWSNGDTTQSTTLDQSDLVFVEVTTEFGCTDQSNMVTFVVHELPPVPALVKDGPVLSTPAVWPGYQWLLDGSALPGATAAQWVPEENGLYTVVVTDSNGCQSTAEPLNVIAIVGDHSVPQAITPNGDGVNDVLKIKGIEFYPENEIAIFSRWGDEVYRSLAYNNDWNGQYRGAALPAGTYYYALRLKPNTQPIKGYVQIEY